MLPVAVSDVTRAPLRCARARPGSACSRGAPVPRIGWIALAALAVISVPCGAVAQTQTAARAAPVRDLRDAFARGFLLEDRNGDEVIDFVRARIVLPATSTEADVVAAANVAARLGYETSALNLDLLGRDTARIAAFDAPVIVVGSGNTLATRARTGAFAMPAGPASVGAARETLAPGEGALAQITSDGFFRSGGLLFEAGDATGLLAISTYFSGRYANVWAVRGTTWRDVVDRVERFLREHDVAIDSLALERIVVAAGRPGISRATIAVRVADSASHARAMVALRDMARSDSSRTDSTRADTAATRAVRDSASSPRVRRADLNFQDLHRLDVRVADATRSEVVRLLPPRAWETRAPQAFTARESPEFTLSDLFTIRGIYRDGNQDLVPDRTEAWLSLNGTADPAGAINLAARVGLETAGMRLPFARVAGQDEHPEAAGFPILFGLQHYTIEQLRDDGRLHAGAGTAGEGFIEFVPRALSGRNALVISGTDDAGLRAITEHVAKRMPWLTDYGKGNYRLSQVETEVRRFFQAREAAGQVALAGHKLQVWLDRLAGRTIDSISIEIAAKERPEGLDRWALDQARTRFPSARLDAVTHKTGFGVAKEIFTEEFDIPWEVDAFRTVFREEALPRIRAGARGRIEVRVSEPPAVRARLESEIRRQLQTRAAGEFDVVVLSAYKQGYSWLHDVILPRLRDRPIGRIAITYHTLEDSKEVRWQEIESHTRWLQEIYPIDAVLARELNLPDSLITFTATHEPVPVYRVRVTDPAGEEILTASFDPKYVIRPYFDLFPEYESLRVTTGWATVEVDGETIVDQRIITDAEYFWDHFQTRTFGRIIEYVMDVQDGRPSPGNAPFFDELRVELALSEPDYRIGIDEEVISSLEALHEDIYFETLTLFDLIGGRYGTGPLNYAGRVLPHIVPGRSGRPGHAKITFTGKERGVPELVLTYRERGGEPVRERYALSPLPVDSPRLRGLAVHAGEPDVARLLFEIAAVDSVDRYDAYRLRGSESQIDRAFLTVPLLAGMVGVLADLHDSGVLEDAVSLDRVAAMKFRFIMRDTAKTFAQSVSLPRSRRPAPTRNPVLLTRDYRHDGQRIVQWRTPIPPAENDSVLAQLATFPGVNVYWLTRSFLGQNTYAADFLPPHDAQYLSQAKLNALKPTLLLSGRQHANEVSSTSHILRLGELLATDSAHRELLKKVNVVLHPMTNPDGARLAYEMQRVNPDFMLHAGYLGALGVDATAGANTDDPIYPESKARPELQQTWLPDIYMNMHGYPSHEWVQYFAGYSAWVRGRTGTQRSWWAPRGWFVPGFAWVDDARHPEIRQAQFAILDSVAAAITAEPDVEAMNRRLYARYAKYGRQDVDNFREDFHNGILVYRALRGREATGPGPNNPRITYFAVTTEAPDETARGDWLELVATAGLAHSTALLRYLAAGQNRIERENTEYTDFVMRSVFRKKPVLPRTRAAVSDDSGR